MSDFSLIIKVLCPIAGTHPRLEVPQNQEPEIKHFSCHLGICSNQSVICNYGGKSCLYVSEALQEARNICFKNSQK
jgi:hypothetical protein